MNWVYEKEAEAFQTGYATGVADAAKALADEALIRVSNWLRAEMRWRRDSTGKLEKPSLAEFVKDADPVEMASLKADAERLRKAAPELLRILKLFHKLFYDGVKAVRADYSNGDQLTFTYVANLARSAIEKAEE